MAMRFRTANVSSAFAGVCAVAVLVTACAQAGPAFSSQQQTAGLTIRFQCDPAVAGEANTLRVAVSDASGKGVTGAHVELRLGMSDMTMYSGALSTSLRPDGWYDVSGVRFSMAGTWLIAVDVRVPNGAAHRVTFPVVVKD